MRLIDTVRTPTIDGLSEPLVDAIRRHLEADGSRRRLFARVVATLPAATAATPG
jgi:hypothetical protein